MRQWFSHIASAFCSMLLLAIAAGCSDRDVSQSDESSDDPPLKVAPVDTAESQLTATKVRSLLKDKNPSMIDANTQITNTGGEIRSVLLAQSGVTDISPLEGLPLRELDLGFLPITDISVLKGMPLEALDLENTSVSDISVLEGMPLRILKIQNTAVADISALEGMELNQLNLFGTAVEDISVVEKLPLKILWIPNTKVVDLSPLQGKYLESLDIQDTAISDLSVVANMTSLRRLNITGSQVTDLTPLTNLQLDRLFFSPQRIVVGLEIARQMASVTTIGTSFEDQGPPDEFWKKFDAGFFKESGE